MSTAMFLYLKDIPGETSDEKMFKYEDAKAEHAAMEITGWSTSYEQPVSMAKSATGPTIERVKAEPISITKGIDEGTYKLLKAVWGGRIILEGWISCWRADHEGGEAAAVEYLRITMKHIVVTTYSISGGEGDIPQEEIGLSPAYVQFSYTPQKKIGGKGGTTSADFNFIKDGMFGKALKTS